MTYHEIGITPTYHGNEIARIEARSDATTKIGAAGTARAGKAPKDIA